MRTDLKIKYILVLAVVGLLSPVTASAQEVTWDIAETLGYPLIHIGKAAALESRAGAEAKTLQEHSGQASSTEGYKDSEKRLRKFYNCMSTISFIMESGETIFNTIGTLNQVKNRMKVYLELYKQYYDSYIKGDKGLPRPEDIAIYETSEDVVKSLNFEIKQLMKSYTSLGSYIVTNNTMSWEMTAGELSKVLTSINESYDHIISILDSGIASISNYLVLRGGFYKPFLLRGGRVNAVELQKKALARWRSAIAITAPHTGFVVDYDAFNPSLSRDFSTEDAAMRRKIDDKINVLHKRIPLFSK